MFAKETAVLTRISAVLAAALVAAGIAACGAAEEKGPSVASADKETLMQPKSAAMKAAAPATYKARFRTTKGDFVLEIERALSPHGADRFYNLVRNGFYNGNKFFRVVPGFVVQWGMSGDPELSKVWANARIPDDPVKASNVVGTITFAKQQTPNTRTTQVFINFKDNARSLDRLGFAPFGRVVEGMEVVTSLNGEYGDAPTPQQQQIGEKGNAFLEKNFPNLDAILEASIEE